MEEKSKNKNGIVIDIIKQVLCCFGLKKAGEKELRIGRMSNINKERGVKIREKYKNRHKRKKLLLTSSQIHSIID